ncbi:MAG: hypothetical protein ABWY50_07675 [Aeromicrobium sp.]
MRTFLPTVAGALLVVLSACTADTDRPSVPATSATPATAAPSGGETLPIFLVGVDSDGLERVEAPVDISVAASGTPMRRVHAAVEAMMRVEDDDERSNLWGRFCGLGDGVGTIETDARRVTIVLTGEGGALCDLSQRAFELRRQQLAWTVVENLGADPATLVRVVTSGMAMPWEDTVVDRAYLAESSG